MSAGHREVYRRLERCSGNYLAPRDCWYPRTSCTVAESIEYSGVSLMADYPEMFDSLGDLEKRSHKLRKSVKACEREMHGICTYTHARDVRYKYGSKLLDRKAIEVEQCRRHKGSTDHRSVIISRERWTFLYNLERIPFSEDNLRWARAKWVRRTDCARTRLGRKWRNGRGGGEASGTRSRARRTRSSQRWLLARSDDRFSRLAAKRVPRQPCRLVATTIYRSPAVFYGREDRGYAANRQAVSSKWTSGFHLRM